MSWHLAGKTFQSRLLLGTARYPTLNDLAESVQRAQVEILTVSLRRQVANSQEAGQSFFEFIRSLNCTLLPNTAGCRSVDEAVTLAQMARELLKTNWIKLELIGDEYTLQPDPIQLIEATQELVAQGFEVFPYCTEDLVIAEKLLAAGCQRLMPWAAPIGSGQGIVNPFGLRTLRNRYPDVPLIIDAGIGAPSQAAYAMELGFDGVLLNTAVAKAVEPPRMAQAFAQAVAAGRNAYEAGLIEKSDLAKPSTPMVDVPFWQQ